MSTAARSRAWMVAASVGLVEGMKDQGFARWNYTLRSIHQHAKYNLRSISQAHNHSSSIIVTNRVGAQEAHKEIVQSEESLRKVMYLSCWGPN